MADGSGGDALGPLTASRWAGIASLLMPLPAYGLCALPKCWELEATPESLRVFLVLLYSVVCLQVLLLAFGVLLGVLSRRWALRAGAKRAPWYGRVGFIMDLSMLAANLIGYAIALLLHFDVL